MQNKPDNWGELTVDEKRAMRLDAWVNSAEHIHFENLDAKQNYIERITLLRDAVEMKKAPARVPVSSMAGGFAMQRAGLHQNVPISMIKAGTADQVTEYCRDLIDYCGRDGGFILSPGCQIDQGKEETVRALINVGKEHLPS